MPWLLRPHNAAPTLAEHRRRGLLAVDREARERIARCIRREQSSDGRAHGEVRGVLRALNLLDQSWLTVVDDEAKPTKCSTPHGMLDDIVGAWVSSRVVVRGTWVAGEFMATDVQPDENE